MNNNRTKVVKIARSLSCVPQGGTKETLGEKEELWHVGVAENESDNGSVLFSLSRPKPLRHVISLDAQEQAVSGSLRNAYGKASCP